MVTLPQLLHLVLQNKQLCVFLDRALQAFLERVVILLPMIQQSVHLFPYRSYRVGNVLVRGSFVARDTGDEGDPRRKQ